LIRRLRSDRVWDLGILGYARDEDFVKHLGLETFIVLFFALVVTCAFDGPHVGGGTRADSEHGASFCGIIHAATALTMPPSNPSLQAYSDETIHPLSDSVPFSSLARAIDHPPRFPGRPL
jgi:hypothetical protein